MNDIHICSTVVTAVQEYYLLSSLSPLVRRGVLSRAARIAGVFLDVSPDGDGIDADWTFTHTDPKGN